jgi:HNH endonuclease
MIASLEAKFEERFFKHVFPEPNTGCWLWGGMWNQDGYAVFSDGNKKVSAHRKAYKKFKGLIPNDLEIDHKCRVRCCVNPDHLRLLTHTDNTALSIHSKETHRNGRKTFCPRGHLFDEANTFFEKNGARKCRTCKSEAKKASYRRNVNPNAVPMTLRTSCPQGHEYTPENTILRPNGARGCRQCAAERCRLHYARKTGRVA